MATFSAKTRASQGSWNTGSFFSYSTGPMPCMPPMSCTPFMRASRPRQLHLGDADHGIARNQCRQFLLAQRFAAGGPLGQHQVADLRCAVPNADLHIIGNLQTEL